MTRRARQTIAVLMTCAADGLHGLRRRDGDQISGLNPPAATSRSLGQVLPTDGELSATLGIARIGFMGRLFEGGVDTLPSGIDVSATWPGRPSPSSPGK
jgi:hypothetical protein